MINLSMSWESGNKDAGGKPKQQQERQSGWGEIHGKQAKEQNETHRLRFHWKAATKAY